jgi:hypothetical protein
MYAHATEVPVDEFPNVKTWFANITALAGWKQTAG